VPDDRAQYGPVANPGGSGDGTAAPIVPDLRAEAGFALA